MDNTTLHANMNGSNATLLPQDADDLDFANEIFFLSSGLQIGGSFLFALMIILALLGNACVCCVIYNICSPELQLITSLLLVNLAISDLLIGTLGMPFSLISLISGRWVLGKAICEITGFLGLMFSMASTLTVACISIDRYCAIVHPLDYLNRMTPLRAKSMVAFIWICPGLCALMPLVGFGRYRFEPAEFHCTVDWEENHAFSLVVFFAGYALPLFVMLYCYYHMFCAARSQARRIDVMPQRDDLPRRRPPYLRSDHIKAVRILCLVIGIFILSWTPYAVLHVCQISMTLSEDRIRHYAIVATYMVYANSVINPYIYTLLYRPFRRGMRNLLRKKCCFDMLRPKPSSAVIVSSRFLRRNAARLKRPSFFLENSEPNYTFDFSSAENLYINDPTDDPTDKEDSDEEPVYVMYDQTYPDVYAHSGHQPTFKPQTLLHEAVDRCHIETLSMGSSADSPVPSPATQRRQTRTSGITRNLSKSSLVKKKLKRSTSVITVPAFPPSLPGEIPDETTFQPAGYVLKGAPRRPTRKTLHHFVIDPFSDVTPNPAVFSRNRISLQHEPCIPGSTMNRGGRYYRAIPVYIKGGNDEDMSSRHLRFSRHRRQESVPCRHQQQQSRKLSRVSLNEHLAGPSRMRRKNSITSTLSYNLEISDVVQFDVSPSTQRKRDEGSQIIPERKRRASCNSDFSRRGVVTTRLSEETELDSEYEPVTESTFMNDSCDYVIDDLDGECMTNPTQESRESKDGIFSVKKHPTGKYKHKHGSFRVQPSNDDLFSNSDDELNRATRIGGKTSVSVRPCIVKRPSSKDVAEKRLDYKNSRQRVSFSDQPLVTALLKTKGVAAKEESQRASDATNSEGSNTCFTYADGCELGDFQDGDERRESRRESIRPQAVPPGERRRRQSVFIAPYFQS